MLKKKINKFGGSLKKGFISLGLLTIVLSGLFMQGYDLDNKTAPDTTAQYNFAIDSTTLSNENHSIYTIIYDSSENSFITQLVNIRVDN